MSVSLERKRRRLLAAILREQKKVFRKHVVREPGRPSLQGPINSFVFEDVTLAALRHHRPPPVLIHAYERTGLLMTADTIHCAEPEELKVWYAAVAGYFAAERKGKVGIESQAYH